MDLIDIHAHILPALDDGPASPAEALLMCDLSAGQGVRAVIATPHVCDPRFDVCAERVREAARRLSDACGERGIDLKVLPGGEVRLTPELLVALDDGRALALADKGRHLLLELPPQVVPRIDVLLFELATRGITPVLTHPECNLALGRKPARLADLVERGCLVQVSAASLLGGFGGFAQRVALAFLKAGLVHFVASDAHSPCGRRSPQLGRAGRLVASLAGQAAARELLHSNPAKVLRGEPVASRRAGAHLPITSRRGGSREQTHKARR